ncbi:U-box domain-containing protein 21 [Arachis duranensis]|uniref:U-box domain-containing protein n=1 Tax=Arachis duranensis TaxID=130453 RepID=A0A6P4CUW6_ARADU|nr:U-box domain-containing protein 21 [Arachis duranensis]
MVLSWTKRKVFRHLRKVTKEDQPPSADDIVIPVHFCCPVSLDIMKDPVTLSTGITYDRDSIDKWLESGNNTCPVTKQLLTTSDMIPNHAIRKMIQDWCVDNSSHGVQRIPTPRVPLSRYDVSRECKTLLSGSQHGDDATCRESLAKIKAWGKENERNKRCVVGNGSADVLARAFQNFSRDSFDKHVVVLAEILENLTWMLPIGEEGKGCLGSENSLTRLVLFLGGNDLGARQGASLVIKELSAEALEKNEQLVESLVKMIREPIGPIATKSCLATISNLVSLAQSRELIAERFVELGLVSLLLDIILDGERGITEKALGVLDSICDFQKGKDFAKSNALMVPLAIKKILRVSELASSFAVSILWKVWDKSDEGALIEALQVGAFQKLLVVLQVGCDDSTKEKATELLKLLNAYRGKAQCVDSSSLELNYLKKSF